MLPFWHDKFVVPVIHEDLVYRGTSRGDMWAEGALLSKDGLFVFPVVGGVPIFVEIALEVFSRVFLALREGRGIDRELSYVKYNWEHIQEKLKTAPSSPWVRYAKMISREDGLIVDIATGLGGGFVPAVLSFDPEAKIMISDVDPLVIASWKRFLDGKYPNVSYACFDATRMPLRSESVDVVVSSGGFGNIPYQYAAFSEAYRILRRGGKLYIADGMIYREDLEKLPKELYMAIKTSFPLNDTGYADFLEKLGFRILNNEYYGGEVLDPQEGLVPRIAYEHGVRLRYTGVYIVAQKA